MIIKTRSQKMSRAVLSEEKQVGVNQVLRGVKKKPPIGPDKQPTRTDSG